MPHEELVDSVERLDGAEHLPAGFALDLGGVLQTRARDSQLRLSQQPPDPLVVTGGW
ncbi:hypothetical protein [Sorangium cellulosum]|uniref:hypothetical protein n=1 Tax=Sorangium cellulosum TaxID=56 RepID=UPI0012FF822E|nr:hypothetical protein [Sorangium cellulosum]